MQENRHVNCNCHGTLSGKMKRLKRTFPEYSACFYFLFNRLKCTCHLNTNSMSCFATLIAPVTVFTNWWWMKPPPNSKCSTNRRFLVNGMARLWSERNIGAVSASFRRWFGAESDPNSENIKSAPIQRCFGADSDPNSELDCSLAIP